MLALVPITTPTLNFVGDVAHSLLRDGTSAFAASALATTLLHPLDTLKTRIQSQRYRVGANGAVVRTRPRRELLTDLHAHAAHAPAHPHTRQQQRERDGSDPAHGRSAAAQAPTLSWPMKSRLPSGTPSMRRMA